MLQEKENRKRELQADRDNRKRQEMCHAIIGETEILLRLILEFKDNPVELKTSVYDKFEDRLWLLPERYARNIRKVYLKIDEANGLQGRTDTGASMRRKHLWYNYLPNDLTALRQELLVALVGSRM